MLVNRGKAGTGNRTEGLSCLAWFLLWSAQTFLKLCADFTLPQTHSFECVTVVIPAAVSLQNKLSSYSLHSSSWFKITFSQR